MTVEVGTAERHQVDFWYDNAWGRLKIQVDGEVVIKRMNPFWVPLVSTWQFDVGTSEPHHVQIEKQRPLFFPIFRKQTLSLFVDGKLVAQHSSFPYSG